MTAYRVDGTLTPDATTATTGEPAGTYGGQPYWSWTNDAGTWFLYSPHAGNDWRISPTLPSGKTDPFWNHLTPITGEYGETNGASGTATVTAIASSTYAAFTINDGPLAGQYIVLKTG